jgi:hypothetical protein
MILARFVLEAAVKEVRLIKGLKEDAELHNVLSVDVLRL